jgi:hypothetical protein
MAFPYYCKECGKEATVIDNRVFRLCDHHGSTIIAERTVKLYGAGGLAYEQSLVERAQAAIRKIIEAMVKRP